MEKVMAVLLANSTGVKLDSQEEIHKPVLIFGNLKEGMLFQLFDIVAKDMNDLKAMYRLKLFYTSSIPVGTKQRVMGALFVGVPEDYYQQ